jgi:hypothetical protein
MFEDRMELGWYDRVLSMLFWGKLCPWAAGGNLCGNGRDPFEEVAAISSRTSPIVSEAWLGLLEFGRRDGAADIWSRISAILSGP